MTKLNSLGWNKFFEDQFEQFRKQGFQCGRIAIENKTNYLVLTEHGDITGEVSGKYLFEIEKQSELPKVGDWVVISLFNDNTHAVIHNILQRKTKISRKSADKKIDQQIIAANVDVVFIVQSLDNNFSINRLERYLAATYQSGAKPVAVLNKADICNDVQEKLELVKTRTGIEDVLNMSAKTGEGIDGMIKYLSPGITITLVGSSGVGKSSLINHLVGYEKLKTNEVREEDSRGRHTTTRRELVLLPSGGILIDTPGMREFGLWNADEGISETFFEFEEFAGACRYSDCTHTHESGCTVLKALSEGIIPKERYENYLKLRKELKYLESKQNIQLQLEEKRKWKTIHKEIKKFNKRNRN
ncbi:MAG: ribosome small subunit-dependent GTPase A [Bacteroidota bacterium]